MSTDDERTYTITANDIETEPGTGLGPIEMQLRRDNARLRRERNAAIERADLAELTLERSSMPPTGKQKAVAVTGKVVQWTGALVLLVTAMAQVAAMYRPDLEAPLRTIAKLLGGLG